VLPTVNTALKGDISRSPFSLPGHRLDRSLLRALAWTGSVKWATQLLSWVSTIVVARLLQPEDYGVVAMAGVFLGLIALLNEFGLGAAVVALRDLSQEQIVKINSLAWCFGALAIVVVCLGAVPAGHFFRSSEVPLVMIVGGLGFMLVAMRSVQTALYEKELSFKLLACLDGVQAVVATITTVILAWWDAGYWALVLGLLIGNAVVTVALLVLRPIPYSWPTIESIREVIRFSSHVLVGRVCWYIASSSDVFIAGRFLGQNLVGVYSFAGTIATIPLEKITGLFSRVMPAFYSAVQTDYVVMQRYLLLLTEGIALLVFPVGIGMALVAQDLVPPVLGEKWEGVVAPLEILASWAAVRSVVALWQPIVYVTGGSRLTMYNGLLCAVIYPLVFWVGSGWGPVGLAVGWVVAQPLTYIAPFRHLLRVCHLSVGNYFRALWSATSGVLVMVISVIAAQGLFLEGATPLLRLGVEVVLGGVTYGGIIMIFHRHRLHPFIQLIKDRKG